MSSEPTYEELNQALHNYAINFDIPGSAGDALLHLSRLREKKFTWVGSDENKLRFAIDNAIRESQGLPI